ncbi:MAG: hypothetical protein QXS27_06740 [Candidatus Jordarchaeaceae archaeon]
MNQFMIPLDEMFLFLNGLFLNDVRRFTVRSLLLNRDLFWVTLSGVEETSEVGGVILGEVYEQLRNKCGEVISEIPSYTEYLNMFLASGVHKPNDWSRITRGLVEELNRDPLRGDRPVFISFDTNALIRRYYTLFSNFLSVENARRRFRPLRAGFVESSGVRKELEKFDTKYNDSDISEMSKTLDVNREILDEFFNQLKLRDRLFRIGYVEYNKMLKQEYFEELEGESGDIKIIETLEKFSKNRNIDILVLSEDSDLIDRANKRKLKGIRLDRPISPPQQTQVTWEEIAQLLYTAAITYGAISITAKTKAKIYGVWKGKKAEHWNTETLKISTENPNLQEFLEKNKKILSKA